MAVRVDKTRRNDPARRVEDLPRMRRGEIADRRDRPADDPDVGAVRFCPASINDLSVLNDPIKVHIRSSAAIVPPCRPRCNPVYGKTKKSSPAGKLL